MTSCMDVTTTIPFIIKYYFNDQRDNHLLVKFSLQVRGESYP